MKHSFEPTTEVCGVCGLTRLDAERAYPECAGAQWAYQPPKYRKPKKAKSC